jgi:hypothetical protein
MKTVIVSLILLFSSTDLAISKTKSEDDALRSLCNIGKNADGQIWGNSKINKAIQILKNGEIISTKNSFLKSYSYKTCNLDRYL